MAEQTLSVFSSFKLHSDKDYYQLMKSMQINRREATLVLSELLGYVGIDDFYHGHRVGYIVWRLAHELGYSSELQQELIEAGLLHDVGVSSTVAHSLLTATMDVPNAVQLCMTGEAIIRSIPAYAHLALMVRYHHDHWQQIDFEQVDPQQAFYSNLIFLADRLDVLMAHNPSATQSEQEWLVERLAEQSGLMFAPEGVEVLRLATSKRLFWAGLESRVVLNECLKNEAVQYGDSTLDFTGLMQIATTFSHVVDAKSHFTHEHSQFTAQVASLLAEKAGFNEQKVEMIQIAGLFHDIGKLRVPDEILDKTEVLNTDERKKIEFHSEDSWHILKNMGGLEEIAEWARMHHEKLNGTGYPRGLSGDEVVTEARVLVIADIFQALLQNRPYRPPMELDHAMKIMRGMVSREEIDEELFAHIENHHDEFHAAATS